MIELLSALTLLFLFILSWGVIRRKFYKGISLMNLFIGYWFCIIFGGSFKLYRLYDTSAFVYFMIILGCAFFLVGYVADMNILAVKRQKSHNVKLKPETSYQKFGWLFYLTLAFAVYIIIKQIMLLLPMIMASGVYEVRGEMQVDEELLLGGYWDILLAYFAKPYVKASIIVILVNMFHHKISWQPLLVVIVLIGLYFLSEGGRGALMEVFFVLLYLLYVNRRQLSKTSRRKMKYALLLIAALPFVATLERGSDVFFSIYTYYCGSSNYLTQFLQYRNDLFMDDLYGIASFQGILKPFFGILQVMGIDKPQAIVDANDFIMSAQSVVFDIAPNCPMNYFVTCFGYAYKDGGIIGVCVIMTIYGILCHFSDRKENENFGNVRWPAFKILFFVNMLFTMSYFPLMKYINAMSIFYIFLITSNFYSHKIKLQ